VVVATIWIAIAISVILPIVRPVIVGIVVPPPIVAAIRITIATIPSIAITTVLRHVAIHATLRVYRRGNCHRYRKREDAHQRQRN
jgi:hypothetical protein